MKRLATHRLLSTLLGFLALASRGLAIDFTPQETWRLLEGVRIPILMFSDPAGKIRYQPPAGWNYSGEGPVFALYPPKGTGAFMKILMLAHQGGIPEITSLPSSDLEKWCQHFIADDAQEVKLLAENPSPFMADGKPSREFVFEYKSSAQRYETSVAVSDWNDHEHLAVIVTALGADFKSIHDAGISSMFSWSVRRTDPPPATPPPTPTASAEPASSSEPTPGPTPIKAVPR